MTFAQHPSFARFVGQWLDGAFEGRGQLFLKNGEQYCGHWRKGVREGVGQYLYAKASPHAAFRGSWAADLFEGDGVLLFKNGQTLIAQFKNGLAEGLGVTLDKKEKVLQKGRFAAGNFVSEAKADQDLIAALQARCAKDFAPEAFPDVVLPALQSEEKTEHKKASVRERSSAKAGPSKPDQQPEAEPAPPKPAGKSSTKETDKSKSKDVQRGKEGLKPQRDAPKASKSKDKKIKKVSVDSED